MKYIILVLLSISILNAAPAFNKLREFKNSDGTSFMAKAKGNQHLNWIQTEDGEVLRYNQKSGNFEYAEIIDESLKPSGMKYEKNNSKRSRAKAHINKIKNEDIHKLWVEKQKKSKRVYK